MTEEMKRCWADNILDGFLKKQSNDALWVVQLAEEPRKYYHRLGHRMYGNDTLKGAFKDMEELIRHCIDCEEVGLLVLDKGLIKCNQCVGLYWMRHNEKFVTVAIDKVRTLARRRIARLSKYLRYLENKEYKNEYLNCNVTFGKCDGVIVDFHKVQVDEIKLRSQIYEFFVLGKHLSTLKDMVEFNKKYGYYGN